MNIPNIFTVPDPARGVSTVHAHVLVGSIEGITGPDKCNLEIGDLC